MNLVKEYVIWLAVNVIVDCRTWFVHCDGTYDSRERPIQVMQSGTTPLTGIIAAAAGYHTLALHTNGSIWAWGDNDGGQLGDGTTTGRNTPGRVMASGTTPFSGVKAIAASYNHSIALKEDGTVWAWGKNTDGQLGDGTKTHRSNPVQVMLIGSSTPLDNVVAIEAGYDHSLALLRDGTVWAWGGNYYGQLGEGNTTPQPGAVQVMLSASKPLTNIIAIAAGGEHSHALADDGTVWSWGDNDYLQIGDGKLSASSYAVQASNMTGGVQVSGSSHSLAVRNDGTIRSWGRNSSGQLGDGSTNDRNIPVPAGTDLPFSTVTQAAAGIFHSLAIQTEDNNSLWSWGANTYGQLGDGTQTSRLTPVRVMFDASTPSEGILDVDGGNNHSVAILNWFNGIIVAWGSNSYAQLGLGTTGGTYTYPRWVYAEIGLTNGFTDVAAGSRHNIALHTAGEVWAWGNNSDGQLGDLSTTQRNKAVKVQQAGATDLVNVVTIAAAPFHNLVIKSDGSLLAWGRNTNGQLGSGDLINRMYASRVRATETEYFSGVTAVAGGWRHSLALKTDGTVWAWGGNKYGQLGNGTYEDSLYPVQVMISATTPLTNVVAISSGWDHSMAILDDGTVWTWGRNSNGQLGNGGRSWYPVKSIIKLPPSRWPLFLPAIQSGSQQ